MPGPEQQKQSADGAPLPPPIASEPEDGAVAENPTDASFAARALAAGECLAGRFLIEEKLGSGAAGTVFVARDQKLGRAVAIKVLSRAPDAASLARFAQEARAAGSLNHANVLVVHDVGVDRGVPFIVSELLRGRTLRARLAEGALPLEEALRLAVQLARGLAATHAHGIVHRDLKPENLFLLEDERLKILDFGLAKLQTPVSPTDPGAPPGLGTESGAIVGTIPYMSPEQVRGRSAEARSDLFAFGAILYEMLSGRAPFPGPSTFEIGHSILHADPARLPDRVPAAVRAIVLRCLAKRPEDRVQSARELVQLLEAIAPEPRRRSLIDRRVLGLSAGVLALLGAAAGWRWVSRHPAPAAAQAPLPRRLAVLPFRVLGASADAEALCAGLGEILTNQLLQLEQLHGSLNVVSPVDVAKEHATSARDARNAFGATLAVTGNIQWSGDRILVAANLVDTGSQLVLEARDFEVTGQDIPAMSKLLVQKVAEMLELEVRPDVTGQGAASLSSSPAYALYLQGRGYLQRYDRVENIDRAMAAFDGALKQDPDFALAHAGKAEAWLRRDRIIRDPSALEHARSSSLRAVELAKDLGQVELTAGLVHLAAGEHALAIEAFQRARRSEPKNPDAIRELGNALDAAGRTAEAEATFQRAVQQTPEAWSALRDLGVFYNRHGRLEEALSAFQRVVAMTPDNYASYASLGGIYLRLGRYQEAAMALQKSLALRPTSRAYNNLGTVRYFERRYLEASDAYRKATQLTPSDERVWAGLADSLRWVPGNSDEAAGAYRQAIALAEQQARRNPHDAELHSRLAMYHAYAGDQKAADDELQEALRLGKQDGAVLFRAVLVHEQMGRREQALRALEEALKAGYSREEIGKDRALDALRQDPRYAPIVSGIAPSEVVK